MKCPTCKGTGKIIRVIKQKGVIILDGPPIQITEKCPKCKGTGSIC